jgi:hypothetical protein
MASGKFPVIEMVQKVLEAIGSDEVNSLSDTVEATQVGRLLEDTFYELLNQKEWDFLMQLIQLEALADSTQPTTMRIPEDAARVDFLRYDHTDRVSTPLEPTNIKDVEYMLPGHFLTHIQARNTDQSNVQEVFTPNGVRLLILNDTGPSKWTSFDDRFIVMDAFDGGIESTLTEARSQAMAKVIPDFQLSDNFTPNVPTHFFQTWLAETKSTAFVYWRQEVSPKDEQRARRGLSVLRRSGSRTNDDDGKARYGRIPI